MTYTAEQLRDMASFIEEQGVPADEQRIKMLRSFADALEENARLRAERNKLAAEVLRLHALHKRFIAALSE